MGSASSSTASILTGDGPEVERHVVAVAAALQRRVGEITATMCAQITDAVDVLADPRLLDLLAASVESNVVALLHLLEHGIPHPQVDAPPAAVEHARRLAQVGLDGFRDTHHQALQPRHRLRRPVGAGPTRTDRPATSTSSPRRAPTSTPCCWR